MQPLSCPLCLIGDVDFYHQDSRREYWQCRQCSLIFVPDAYHLSEQAEKAQYDLHQNDPQDAAYRQFLMRLATPLLTRLESPGRGLDFGSGPGPVLHLMLEEQGHKVALYDKFYANAEEVLRQTYDFITATEVVEHLSEPGAVLERLWGQLVSGGWLALMTKRVTSRDAFSGWHYKNDPTHIVFFSEETFSWLASRWRARLDFPAKDVVIFQKP